MNIVNVVLDADTVTHNLAARLSTCLLGHVLFLKNQVPFPVMQLARMPTNDTSSRAAKMKQELITSFDTLASHLYTTFIALSTSLALRGITETNNTVSMPPVNTSRIGRVFMAILLGPTVGTAKARVILGIDGFEVKRWGFREDEFGRTTECDAEDNEAENEDDQIGTDEDDSGHAPSSESDSEDTESSSPPSRSSSPSLSESSSISSSDIPDPHQDTARTSPDPLRTAERHLSRILANACAEDTNGEGLASEMAPTLTHILIRTPRRFTHPSWTPRQNISGTMEAILEAFLCESGEVPREEETSARAGAKKKQKGRVEGIWIRARGSDARDGEPGRNWDEDEDEDVAEEDEWIWWSWDGKLMGFADW